MPEGPEMVFLKERMEQFVGQVVVSATGHAKNIPFNQLTEQPLNEIRTFGKELLLCFADTTIRVHLMFFGKYAINGEVNRELQLGLEFEDSTINFYACDCRVVSKPLDEVYDWPRDVMHPDFDLNTALKKIEAKPNRLICDALLDQEILAGVGNGIKNEVLFKRQIHPESLAGEIPEPELRKLIQACVTQSYEYLQGIQDGTVKEHWLVYQQKICPRDRIPLRKEKIGKGGRSCYFCDKCQQLYLPDSL